MNNEENPTQADVFFMIYGSSAVEPFTSAKLIALLNQCRVNNEQLGVTGMLLYKDGNFMQIIEGEEQTVRRLYDKIMLDARHTGVVMFLQGTTQERQFPDWSMGFRDLNSDEEMSIPGYSEFMKTKLTDKEFFTNPTRAQKLLLFFKKSR